jgi:hypothetical protein
MRVLTVSIVLSALPLTVASQSACPTGADLATGIVITYGDGQTDTFSSDSSDANLVIVETADDTGPLYRRVMIRGVYEVSYSSLPEDDPDAMGFGVAFPMAPADAPLPIPDESWRVEVTPSDGSGETLFHDYTSGASIPVTIGDCVYDTIPVVLTAETGDDVYEIVHFIPALGLGYVGAQGYADVTMEDPRPVAIRRVE